MTQVTKRTSATLIAMFIMLAGAMAGHTQVYADTIPVTSTEDSGPDTLLPGTLREALAIAADGDTIDATGISGVVTLVAGLADPAELVIDKNVTILGPGPASLTIDANHLSRVFHVFPGHTVTIEGLRMINGAVAAPSGSIAFGGGIFNDHSNMTVTNCVLSNNSGDEGGAIGNIGRESGSASLMLVSSTLSGNKANVGAGIYSDGFDNGSATATLIDCTVSGNSASSGGGIVNAAFQGRGVLTVTGSTLSGNVATFGEGGAISSDGSGPGFAIVNIGSTTFSSNSAGNVGGGIFNDSSRVQISDCTFSGNTARLGGGIFIAAGANPATLVIGNTILKAGIPGENIFNDDGDVISHGFNLSSDDGGGYLTATGDQFGLDPLIGPLQDNGGPTRTHQPLAGSPAIDQGLSGTIAALATSTDQRGSTRTIDDTNIPNAFLGDGTDIGSVELVAPNHPPVAICKSVTVLADASGKANASIDDGSFDPDSGDTIILAQDPPEPYLIGVTSVALTVTDSHGATSSCSATVTVVGVADLFVSKAVVSGQAKPGQMLTYTLTVTNLGPNPATDVVLTDPVPQGTTYSGSSPTASSAPPVGAGGTVTWNLGSLESGASVKLTLKVIVSLKGNALIVNTATVSSGSFDPSLANNTATVTSKRNTK